MPLFSCLSCLLMRVAKIQRLPPQVSFSVSLSLWFSFTFTSLLSSSLSVVLQLEIRCHSRDSMQRRCCCQSPFCLRLEMERKRGIRGKHPLIPSLLSSYLFLSWTEYKGNGESSEKQAKETKERRCKEDALDKSHFKTSMLFFFTTKRNFFHLNCKSFPSLMCYISCFFRL